MESTAESMAPEDYLDVLVQGCFLVPSYSGTFLYLFVNTLNDIEKKGEFISN